MLVDLVSHHVVDLLPGREKAPLIAWPADHPGIEMVCRDRAGAYAEAASAGAPQARQVADACTRGTTWPTRSNAPSSPIGPACHHRHRSRPNPHRRRRPTPPSTRTPVPSSG
ncbi:transposase [Streptomyces sp. NPDC048106]|uniref:transposase n=1 Tax=Streptomyces sp. NPDC048106 TaxID=3155750 RepID=UPI003455E660